MHPPLRADDCIMPGSRERLGNSKRGVEGREWLARRESRGMADIPRVKLRGRASYHLVLVVVELKNDCM